MGGNDEAGPMLSDLIIKTQFSADVDFVAHQTFTALLALITEPSSKKTVDE